MKRSNLPENVRKRDGSLVKFDTAKIEGAIKKAALEILVNRRRVDNVTRAVTDRVLKEISDTYKDKVPGIEDIQDIIENVLMHEGYSNIARRYILYREEHSRVRSAKFALGLKDDLKLPINSIAVLKKRYLLKDDRQNIIETPGELFRRVAYHVAQAERRFRSKISATESEDRFYNMMRNLDFLPNSPTLMNAGSVLGQLSACFVLPVEDSIDGIFAALHNMAKIHQTGGGTGFDFSRLRPNGDLVTSTKGEASGPVSFMSIFDRATEVIVQGGRRRGANMAVLRCDHPDIFEFVDVKRKAGVLSNFNISVGITDKFMYAVKKGIGFGLVNPRTGKEVKRINARELFDRIASAARDTGDPGLIFLDEINRRNPMIRIGRIEATNPCGELPLLPYESCNLASVNLSRMVRRNSVDWIRLKNCVRWGIRFLDNVIEVNRFPLSRIKRITLANRKIGLGVMGFSDMLIQLGIPYNSKEAVSFAEKIMRFIHKESISASENLARERGVFPNFKKSLYAKKNLRLRNATVNTIAPTGTISIIAGCSSGIEPLFAISFVRNVLAGTRLFENNPWFENIAKKRGFYTKDILTEVARAGTLCNIKGIPEDVKKIFVTAFDIAPEQHLRIQAAFQKYTDNSVSKTINLPTDTQVEDVKKIYRMAYKLKCKGITIYRYGSRTGQVLTFGGDIGLVTVDAEYSGGCASGTCPF